MPLPVESLTPESDVPSIRAAIGKSIGMCIKEGKEQQQCAAIAYDIAREKTGKELSEGTIK